MFIFRAALLPLTLALTAGTAVAQNQRPDPRDAQAAVPALNYGSPLAGYRAFADQDVSSWRDSNDTAGRIGGWRVYAREAAQPAAEPQSEPAPRSGSGDHSQHHRSTR
jgi:hypothetical protein